MDTDLTTIEDQKVLIGDTVTYRVTNSSPYQKLKVSKDNLGFLRAVQIICE